MLCCCVPSSLTFLFGPKRKEHFKIIPLASSCWSHLRMCRQYIGRTCGSIAGRTSSLDNYCTCCTTSRKECLYGTWKVPFAGEIASTRDQREATECLRAWKWSVSLNNEGTKYQVWQCFHGILCFVSLTLGMRGSLSDGMNVELIDLEVRMSRCYKGRLSALFILLYSKRDDPSEITSIYAASETVPQRWQPSSVAK